MSSHMVAWQQSVDSATITPITTVVDDVLTRTGTTRYLVPAEYNYLHWGYAAGPDITRGVLFTPSLGVRRQFAEIFPHNRAAESPTLATIQLWKPSIPIALVPTEELEAQVSEDNAAASQVDVFATLGPAEMAPIPSGDIRVNRMLGTATLTARTWSTVTMTPDLALEPGDYSLIGFLANSATIVACRALFQGQTWRPGVLGVLGAEADGKDYNPSNLWPYGGYDMGRFTHITIPQFQFWATAADTSERVYMISVKL